MTGAEVQSFLIIGKMKESDQFLVIVERFADAHDHDTVDPLSCEVPGQKDLTEHLSSRK